MTKDDVRNNDTVPINNTEHANLMNKQPGKIKYCISFTRGEGATTSNVGLW